MAAIAFIVLFKFEAHTMVAQETQELNLGNKSLSLFCETSHVEMYNSRCHGIDCDDLALADLSVLIHHGRNVVATDDDTKGHNGVCVYAS